MGKPKHSTDTRGEQKGAVERDESLHGDKAYQARKDEISDHHQERGGQHGKGERAQHDPRADGSDADQHERLIANPGANADGGHRLFENRTQHDEAEQGSERNRRDIDVSRHGHAADKFQGHDAPDGGTGAPDTIKQAGRGGGNRSDEDRGGKQSS